MIRFIVHAVPTAQPRQRHRVAIIGGMHRVMNYTPAKHPVNAFKAAVQHAFATCYNGPPPRATRPWTRWNARNCSALSMNAARRLRQRGPQPRKGVAMLVLTRRRDERIVLRIAGNVEAVITVCALDGNKARIGVEAPSHVAVLREELTGRIIHKPEDDKEGSAR